jgi:hypothetical protein|tara:strand:+ start:729 stop:1166 length:438 start_codon:yes stop_codon:yes gene_type:complete
MEVSLVDPDYLHLVWGEASSALGISVDAAHGRYSLENIAYEISTGEQHLWVVFDDDKKVTSALTTRFISYPGKRLLSGQFLGGEGIMRWRDSMLETLEKWAVDNDCDGMEMTGRRGFERILGPHGWTPEYTVFEKMFEENGNGQG